MLVLVGCSATVVTGGSSSEGGGGSDAAGGGGGSDTTGRGGADPIGNGGGGAGGDGGAGGGPVVTVEPMMEGEACETLLGAYVGHGLELGCPTTTRLCPDLLRHDYGACMLYDTASVEGCIERYQSATDCPSLYASFDCEVSTIEGSAPNGCAQ